MSGNVHLRVTAVALVLTVAAAMKFASCRASADVHYPLQLYRQHRRRHAERRPEHGSSWKPLRHSLRRREQELPAHMRHSVQADSKGIELGILADLRL